MSFVSVMVYARICVYCCYHNNETQNKNNNSQSNSNNNKKNKNKACYASFANKMGPKFMFVLPASRSRYYPIIPGDFSVFLANIKVCVLFALVSACFVSWPFAYLANLCYALLLALSTRHNIRVWPRTWLRARLQVPTRATGCMSISATSFCLSTRRCSPCRIMNHCSGFSLVRLCACVER